MATTIPVKQRKQLVKFYEGTIAKLADLVARHSFTKQEPRFSALLAAADRELRRLDKDAAAWIQREIADLYRGNLRFIDGHLATTGKVARSAAAFALPDSFDQEAIRLLVSDPVAGMGPRVARLNNQLRDGVNGYVAQHRRLLKQLRSVRSEVAAGLLTGRSGVETRNAIIDGLLGSRDATFLGIDRLSQGKAGLRGPIQTLLDAPYLVKSNGARLHIVDYVQQVVTTTEARVRTEARNNRMLKRGVDLVRIDPHAPLTPDVCSVYAGRVYALTEDAAKRTGFPHYARLPGGGSPFHPFCTHSTQPFFEDLEMPHKDVARSGIEGIETIKGTPVEFLDIDFRTAQAEFKGAGGIQWAMRQNPQLRDAAVSSSASDEIKKALRPRGGRLAEQRGAKASDAALEREVRRAAKARASQLLADYGGEVKLGKVRRKAVAGEAKRLLSSGLGSGLNSRLRSLVERMSR